MVSGSPDLIAKYADDRTVVYNAKIGSESPSHLLQVQLYMCLLSRLANSHWRGTRLWDATNCSECHDRADPRDFQFKL